MTSLNKLIEPDEKEDEDFEGFDDPAGDDWEIDPDMGCH